MILTIKIEEVRAISQQANNKKLAKMQKKIQSDAEHGFYESFFHNTSKDEITLEMLQLFTAAGFTVDEAEEDIVIRW